MYKFGTILKPVGLKGEVKVFSDSDFLIERLTKGQVFKTSKGDLTLTSASLGSNVHRVKFVELKSIEEAEKFRQVDLMLDELNKSLLEDDEFFVADLVGCDVYENNQLIGQVLEVIDYVAHPVLRIGNEGYSFMVPFITQFVPQVKIESNRIDVELIEGMR